MIPATNHPLCRSGQLEIVPCSRRRLLLLIRTLDGVAAYTRHGRVSGANPRGPTDCRSSPLRREALAARAFHRVRPTVVQSSTSKSENFPAKSFMLAVTRIKSFTRATAAI